MVDQLLGVAGEGGTGKGNFSPVEQNHDSPYIQVPDNATKSRLEKLVQELTEDQSPGWQQVDAIVNHLRSEFEHDTTRVPSPDREDSVGSFLDERGGPSYLFATTATQMLRLAGYRTRLRSGFLVTRKDYDRVALQSVVDSSNVHMWPEVCIDGWSWIPVEPTPGYPIPCNAQTIWQAAKVLIVNAINWMIKNPITSIGTAGLLLLSFWYRKQLVVTFFWLLWKGGMLFTPQRRLGLTRQLIDWRFWAAGMPRPSFASIDQWYSRVDSRATSEFNRHWYASNFSSNSGESKSDIPAACRKIVSLLTCQRIREFEKEAA